MDILSSIDTLIAFVTVMLLFSVLVTGLVQATQSFFRLRGRNLRSALSRLVQECGVEDQREAGDIADRVLDRRLLIRNRSASGPGQAARSLRAAVGPAASRIEREDLSSLLSEEMPADTARAANVAAAVQDDAAFSRRFTQMESVSSKRFLGQVRLVTIFWAALVAFSFQLSVFDLFRNISTDAQLRAELVAASQFVAKQTNTAIEGIKIQDVSEAALDAVARKFPNLATRLEEVSGIGSSEAELVEEMRLVAAGDKAFEPVVSEYEETLANLHKAAAQAAGRVEFG